ncbi:MAG: DDE-type integrase/transposase/recombinase [Winogradskyella sp.]|nr:DDE-type integrase/transposase/recombinase [Winogradskyella sp.]
MDRATRTLYYQVYDAKSGTSTKDFLEKCIEFFTVYITHAFTDNGLEFTNRLLKSKKGEPYKKPSKFDKVCTKINIDHRCTKPFTPKTNVMVEKANDNIKQKTIKKNNYNSLKQMKQDLMYFLVNYNLHRRLGSLRRELKVKTPFDAVVKWYE